MAVTPYPNPATQYQVPDHSFFDLNGKQAYLGNAYVLAAADVSLDSTSETGLVYIVNPTGTGKALFCNLRRFTSSAQAVQIKLYSQATVTSLGTKSVPINLRPASPNTSVSNCYANGQFTISENGNLMSNLGTSGNDYVVQDEQLLVIVDPGQNILITGTALVESTVVNSDVSWFEL